ncbi:MAG: hypothetical protein L3K15_09010, partial [Thermoplasmata archaeon]|nr:hypothetical protein [Thermoplasmata archaeon]
GVVSAPIFEPRLLIEIGDPVLFDEPPIASLGQRVVPQIRQLPEEVVECGLLNRQRIEAILKREEHFGGASN